MMKNRNSPPWLLVTALALVIAAFLGPWFSTSDGVPPPEWCAAPNHLLENGRCVRFAPGTELLMLLGSFFFNIGDFLTSQPRLRELLFVLVLSFTLLPFAAIVVQALPWKANPAKQRVLCAVLWGLALIPVGIFLYIEVSLQHPLLWGIGLYAGVVIAMLLYEIAGLYVRIRPAQVSPG